MTPASQFFKCRTTISAPGMPLKHMDKSKARQAGLLSFNWSIFVRRKVFRKLWNTASMFIPTACMVKTTQTYSCQRSNHFRQKHRFIFNGTSLFLCLFSESVQLVGSLGNCQGSVEVKSDQGWASVCEDGFDSEAQKVVCRELVCGPPRSFLGSFRKGEPPVLSKQFYCKGSESRREHCASSTRIDCRPAFGISCTNMYICLSSCLTICMTYGKTLMSTDSCGGTYLPVMPGSFILIISRITYREEGTQ